MICTSHSPNKAEKAEDQGSTISFTPEPGDHGLTGTVTLSLVSEEKAKAFEVGKKYELSIV